MSDPNQTTNPSNLPTLPELYDEIQKAAQKEVASAQTKDPLVAVENRSLEAEKEAEKLEIANERLRDELKEARDLHELRKTYTTKLFWLIVGWLLVVVLYVFLAAAFGNHFKLSDSVLIAFITSTTVSVLGLFIVVAKWLFPSIQKDEAEKKKTSKQEEKD